MFIAWLTLLSALSISGVAIFYSVIGLATIFPGAFWPVVIMGSVLEIGKLVTASWLYRNWKQTRFLLKTYLSTAVVVLSLITSMGIFGFLSKAHLEQNLAEDTVTQRIEIINNKITSEETYIKRQTLIIERAEKSLSVVVSNNSGAIDIEKDNIKSIEDKFKTLLAVETNTIKNLNERLTVLDKDVSDVLTANKSFFNEEKAAADLKASQKEEREQINQGISEAQDRINQLKDDYAVDTAVIQKRIDNLRNSDVGDKSEVEARIDIAEANIVKAQNNIDDLIVDREPLQAKMIKLEAEVGPVKYIAALAVDWGVTNEVDTSEAVRWVILIIICVFDPLAVLLLVAANQSLLRRFPVKPLPPEEVIDLENPDDDNSIILRWKDQMSKKMEEGDQDKLDKATAQLKEWQDKLDAFNKKVPKQDSKHVEIVQKKTEQEEIDAYKEKKLKEEEYERKIQQQAEKEKQLEDFKKREQEDLEALEEYSRKARAEVDNTIDGFDPDEVEGYEEFNKKYEPTTVTVEEALKLPESKSVETDIEEPTISKQIEEAMESERTRPDFTEVIEPEQPKQKTPSVGMIGSRIVKKGKTVDTIEAKVKQEYVQNEEQTDKTLWQKSKKRLTTEEEYRNKINERIDNLMTQLDNKEITIEELTPEDRQTIIDIRMQNESGDKI